MQEDGYDNLVGFGARLTAAIKAANTTASHLARELNVTPQAIYNLESREGGVGAARLFRIADILRTDPVWLATGRTRPIIQHPSSGPAPATFGERLDVAMRNAGFSTQTSLSSASGVPQATISRLLSAGGASGPETDTVRKLARACSVSTGWLLDGVDDQAVPLALSSRQWEWLRLMDQLGSDDLDEFSNLISQRQARNTKLLFEFGLKI